MTIINALDVGDLDLARDLLLEDIYAEVGEKRSWDSPQYRGNRIIQDKLQQDKSKDKLFTYFGLEVLRDRYFLRDDDGKICETPQDWIARVSAALCRKDERLAFDLYEIISKHWFMPATPILSNIGSSKALPISCFLNLVPDDVESIFDSYKENAILAKNGGGIGSCFSDVRGGNAKLRTGGRSSGIIPFLKVMDSATLAVSQGGVRRGSAAVYLDVQHPDIEEFVDIRKPTGGDENRRCLNLHNAVNVTDKFIQAVKDDSDFDLICPNDGTVQKTIKARDLWKKILKNRVETGEPYLLFIDTVNKSVPAHHREKGLMVKQSNLCFSGDTVVAVADGRNGVTIKELAKESEGKKSFPVYCAREAKIKRRGVRGGGIQESFWATEVKSAVAFKTGVKKLVEVILDDGSSFKCTKDHRVALKDGGYKEASKLEVGESLQPFNTYTRMHKETPYRHICSKTNGNAKQHRLIWEYYNGDIPKGYHIDHINNDIRSDNIDNLQIMTAKEHRKKTSKEISGKNNWVYRMDEESRAKWIKSKNKMATGENNPNYSGLTNDKLIEIGKYIHEKYGKLTESTIKKYREETGVPMPYTFSKNRFGSIHNLRSIVVGNHKVKKIVVLEEEQEVYDLTVEDNHNFYIITSTQDDEYLNCSGVLVHNCSEITLPTNEDRTAVCCLGSLNLERWDEFSDRIKYVVSTSVKALDNVLDIFIKHAKSDQLKKAVYSASQERSIGLGVMGWHGYLMGQNISFGSPMAFALNNKIFKEIKQAAVLASAEVANEKEPCPDGGYLRNSYLLSIAPTANISVIAGNSTPCIEPITGNAYMQKTLSGTFLVKNRYLELKLIELGKNTQEIWESIILAQGSVQHLDFLSDDDKNTFKTAYEINQKDIVRQAADRQKHICQSQSLNLFFAAPVDAKYLNEVHLMAHELGCKSLYYLRSNSLLKNKKSQDECEACQ